MTKAPAFQFYPKDWLSDAKVKRLSWVAKGVYIELLALMWNEGKDRLADDDDIAAMLGMQVQEWRSVRDELQREKKKVFIERKGYLVSTRLEAERRKQRRLRKMRQKAARCKWKAVADAKRCSSSASSSAASAASSASQKKQKKQPSSPGGDKLSEGFKAFWKAWPGMDRKQGKKQCWQKWKRDKLEPKTKLILECLETAKKSRDWKKGFDPMPMTWLNRTPWLTERPAKHDPRGPVPAFTPQMREARKEDIWRRLTDEARQPWIEKARAKLAKTPAPTRFGSGKWPESVIREAAMELWWQDRLWAGKEH